MKPIILNSLEDLALGIALSNAGKRRESKAVIMDFNPTGCPPLDIARQAVGCAIDALKTAQDAKAKR